MYEQYEHYGAKVWVRSDLKGKHRDICLCHACSKLDMVDEQKNCNIARMLYHICKEFHLVVPLTECPEFIEKNSPSV